MTTSSNTSSVVKTTRSIRRDELFDAPGRLEKCGFGESFSIRTDKNEVFDCGTLYHVTERNDALGCFKVYAFLVGTESRGIRIRYLKIIKDKNDPRRVFVATKCIDGYAMNFVRTDNMSRADFDRTAL